MPFTHSDLNNYLVEETFDLVRSAVFATHGKNDVIQVLQSRLLPLRFRVPAQNEEIRRNAPGVIDWSPTFLEYTMGKTTITNFGTDGAISGPFSGCWYIKFEWKNRSYVAHIGTGDSHLAETQDVKAAFLDWTCKNNIRDFVCFNPWKAYNDEEQVRFTRNSPYLLGCITQQDTCYSIFLNKADPKKSSLRKMGNWPIDNRQILRGITYQTVDAGPIHPGRVHQVMDVRPCPRTSWESEARHIFVESMYKNNRLDLSNDRKNEIKKFHYGG
jgi:hypothetical protein